MQSLDLEYRDEHANTLLHVAVQEEQNIDDLLESQQYNVEWINAQNSDGQTALHLAAQDNNIEAVKTLHAAGAHLEILDAEGQTPFHIAAEFGCMEVVEYLLSHDVNIFTESAEGNSVLYDAACLGEKEMVIFLQQKGLDINHVNHAGNTALSYAAFTKNYEMLNFLLENGANINQRDDNKYTVLMYEVDLGNLGTVKELFAHREKIFQDPLQILQSIKIARDQQHTEILKFIIDNL